jgi:hypothetical protein
MMQTVLGALLLLVLVAGMVFTILVTINIALFFALKANIPQTHVDIPDT